VRVVLGEDLTLLRDGLIRLLTAYDMDVVAAVDNGPELVRALVTHRPDVAVVDVRLPPSFTDEGLKAAIEARAAVPGLPVLVLSQHVEPLYAKELLSSAAGGLGYCSRTGSRTCGGSSRQCAPSPAAAPPWTPRSSRS
jgi:DNA-binding NarL/FixJ family response regulator